ncbi:TerB family tellurite resistance protein [Azoarcus sp. L1K30]|uniref:tellurite resistance TerB family protein n=1 Tax=Azoarcus sp. L1K30 TaxID=2820277 RepID=UPI001B810061|nr:TerB family tellurite resistance protein [Azoarcus sp. L1K30]MBR0566273.1 TerB family tellurite resistance protein [Azoarcus sp. L1K30]
MLRTLKDLFNSFMPVDAAGGHTEDTLQLATAVLLVEVMRSDAQIDAEERAAILAALGARFNLDESARKSLLELAEHTSSEAVDFHRFTSRINTGLDAAEKVRVIELMWQVAFADGHLSSHENHLMRKIADLLHISHADYVLAKQQARAALDKR